MAILTRFKAAQHASWSHLVIVVVTAAFLLAPVSPASSVAADSRAAAKVETHLLCLNGDGSEYRRKHRPKRCAIYGRGGIFAGGVNPKELKWRGWGRSCATATGIECGFHLPCADIKAKVRAWRPRERCGKRVYTRLKATTRFGTSRAGVRGCPGSAF